MNLLPVTYIIIGLTAALSLVAFYNTSFFEKSLFSIDGIKSSGDYYRIISSMFIHANFAHLLFNMFSFYAFSRGIEMKYGAYETLLLYLGSGLGSGLLSVAVHRNDSGYTALGASGAVSGVIFASIFLIPGGSIIVFPLPVPLPAWLYAILFVFGSIYAAGRTLGGIAHDAHLGGALTGVIIAAAIDFQMVARSPLLVAAVVVPVVIFFIFGGRIQSLLRG